MTTEKTTPATLEVRGLHASVEGKPILRGIDLTIRQGEIHALMGPNGSGKSTLSNVIMGRPGYVVTEGQVLLDGENITPLTADERAKRGLFLAMQYPTEIPGVSVVNFLRTAYQSIKAEQISALAFRKHMKTQMERLGIEDSMVQRYVNQGFSGGEKKRNEVLQLAVLEPKIALLDETDSGLDIDSLKLVAESVNELIGPELGVLVITHYQRMLNYITPDYVHVMMLGRIVQSGGPELSHELEDEGLRGHPARARPRGVRDRRGGAGLAVGFDAASVRLDFPIFERRFDGKPLGLPGFGGDLPQAHGGDRGRGRLLSAAQRERPPRHLHLGRGGDRALRAGARRRSPAFFGVEDAARLVFTRGTTESINLVALGWGRAHVPRGRRPIVLTEMEHHSNIVPWQLLAKATGAELRYIGAHRRRAPRSVEPGDVLTERTKVLAVTAMSNALGTITPLARLVDAAHAVGAIAVVDAAQAAPHLGLDLQALGADAVAFSGHKMLGPTASGGLARRPVPCSTTWSRCSAAAT